MEKKDFNELINSETPVLVDFFAEWCGPCQWLSPVLKDVAVKVGDKAKIVKVDIDKNQETARKYDIMAVPTLIIFKKGEIMWRETGVPPMEMIEKAIEDAA